MLRVTSTPSLIFVLLTDLSSCGPRVPVAAPAPATAPAPGTPPSDTARTPGEVKTSNKYGYRWSLPADWHFVPAETVQAKRLEPWYELTVAKRHGEGSLLAAMLVTDALSPDIGRDSQHSAEPDRDRIERGEGEFREAGVDLLATSRQRMLGVDVVQLDGVRAGLRVSFRIYDRENVRFEFRCIGGAQSPPWPCDDAFAHIDFGAAPAPIENTALRPLHIRDEDAGFTFEPPDDTWLSNGPHRGTGGAEVLWAWDKDERNIAVHVTNLSMYPASRTMDLEKLMEGFRRKAGAFV